MMNTNLTPGLLRQAQHTALPKGKGRKQSGYNEKLPLDRILPNPEQPRKKFDAQALDELAQSIREHGVIEPVIVELSPAQGGRPPMYILHDGERRFRAAKLAGLKYIPARIVAALNGSGPRERLERALVANIQREDMTPVERALAYERMRTDFGMSVKDMSSRTGKNDTLIRNDLRLAELVRDPQAYAIMQERKLSTETKVVTALLSIPQTPRRVALMQELAARGASANVVVSAVNKMQGIAKGRRFSAGRTEAQKLSLGLKELPEYDALFALGKVPAWQALNDAVMHTCDTCALRPMAGPALCGPCALVGMLQTLTGRTEAAPHPAFGHPPQTSTFRDGK